MSVQAALSKDDPRMVAWEAYKETEDFVNAHRWAIHVEHQIRHPHIDGSLWAMFLAGYQAGSAKFWTEGLPPNEIEIAWLLLQHSEDLRIVKLAVYDDDGTWSEAGDWKGESYKDVIDLPIIGWLPFELPKPPAVK